MDEGGEIVDRTKDYADSTAGGGGWGESVDWQIARFVTAIRTGEAPSQTPRELRNLQRIQDAIYQSASTGREVRLDAEMAL